MVVRLVVVVLIVGLLALIDGPRLLRCRQWRELGVAAAFLAIGAALATAVALGRDIYSPADLVIDLTGFLMAGLSRLW